MALLRLFARYAYVPAMLLGLTGLAVYLVAEGHSLLWMAALLGVAVGLSLLMERVLPYEPNWNQSHDDTAKDIAHGVIYEISNLTAFLMLPFITMLEPWRGIWPSALPIAAQLLMAIVIADGCMTVIHYLSHRVGVLWRLHAVHHGVHRLYGFNGFVRHPLHQSLDLAVGTLPLVLAGLPLPVAALLGFAISVQLLVQHSNVDYALGPFRQIIAIGPAHRLHHVNWAGEGDVNFGLFFTVWDRLVGTLRLDCARVPRAGDVGIEDSPNFPQRYVTQFAAPFKSR
jgi:sterol desaturase/sphingolipid hydroxylase (fatty acid hydroxylase superfamily)